MNRTAHPSRRNLPRHNFKPLRLFPRFTRASPGQAGFGSSPRTPHSRCLPFRQFFLQGYRQFLHSSGVATAFSAPFNPSAATRCKHNENTLQAANAASFQISINQESRSQRRIPSELLPNLVRKGLQYRVPSNTRRKTVRLRGHRIDHEGASGDFHHRANCGSVLG